MAEFDWTPITASFGAEVHGLDIAAALAPDTAAALRTLWNERGLLLFRGQQIEDAAQVRLTQVFGPAPIHKASDTHLSQQRELITISYTPEKPDETLIYEVEGRRLANWQPWHCDTIYTETIERGGTLRAIAVPAKGADTGFADRAQAWDRLPEDLRREAERIRVLYHLTPVSTESRFNYCQGAKLIHVPERIRQLQRRALAEFPVVSHPAMFVHPESGRKTLNIGPLHAIGIEGRENAEGDVLLRELIAASVELGERYYHCWRRDDVVVWDNWRFLHSAEGTPTDVNRVLYRSGIAGDYGLGREVRMMSSAA
ncbi:MAG: TauD/TfdA family dioxygenase [Novosphingobium sp.]